MIVQKGGKYLSSDTADISEDLSFRHHHCENPKSRSVSCPDFVLTDTPIPVVVCLMCTVGRMTDPLSGDRHSCLVAVDIFQAFTLRLTLTLQGHRFATVVSELVWLL